AGREGRGHEQRADDGDRGAAVEQRAEGLVAVARDAREGHDDRARTEPTERLPPRRLEPAAAKQLLGERDEPREAKRDQRGHDGDGTERDQLAGTREDEAAGAVDRSRADDRA